jgi:hypothetical protein
VRGLGKGHFLTIAVDIVVARNAEDFFARDGGRRRQFIEERDSKFVLGGLSRVGDVTGREDKVEIAPALRRRMMSSRIAESTASCAQEWFTRRWKSEICSQPIGRMQFVVCPTTML